MNPLENLSALETAALVAYGVLIVGFVVAFVGTLVQAVKKA